MTLSMTVSSMSGITRSIRGTGGAEDVESGREEEVVVVSGTGDPFSRS